MPRQESDTFQQRAPRKHPFEQTNTLLLSSVCISTMVDNLPVMDAGRSIWNILV